MRKGYRTNFRGQVIVLMLVFLFSLFGGFSLPVLGVSYGIVKASALTVRKGPGTNYAKIGTLYKGQKVELAGSKGSWYKIRYKTGYGYVLSKYISLSSESSRGSEASRTGTITATTLNVRKNPSTSAAVVGKLGKGTRVEIFKEQNGWYYIKAGTTTGWVVKNYVAVSETSRGTTSAAPQTTNTNTIPATTISGSYVVKATSLNLRSGPGTGYAVLKSLVNGTVVSGLKLSGDWMQVKEGTAVGWVAKSYLAPYTTESSRGDTLRILKTVYPTIDPLNVFNGAGFATGVKASISGEKSFGVLEEKDGWYRLALGEREVGWAEKAYFSDTPVTPIHPVDIKAQTALTTLTWELYTTAKLTYSLSQDKLSLTLTLENGQVEAEKLPGSSFPVKSFAYAEEGGNSVFKLAGYVPLNVNLQEISGGYKITIAPLNLLNGKKIVLDPGHGGDDPGAIGKIYGIKEKDVNLDIALKLKGYLEAVGATVYMTRSGDTYPTLLERYTMANNLGAGLFISIHQNSVADPKYYTAKGSQVYYYADTTNGTKEKALADNIMVSLNEVLGTQNKGINSTRELAVTKNTKMPSALVEVGFLSNAEEEMKLSTEEYRAKAAAALAQGITKWFLGK